MKKNYLVVIFSIICIAVFASAVIVAAADFDNVQLTNNGKMMVNTGKSLVDKGNAMIASGMQYEGEVMVQDGNMLIKHGKQMKKAGKKGKHMKSKMYKEDIKGFEETESEGG